MAIEYFCDRFLDLRKKKKKQDCKYSFRFNKNAKRKPNSKQFGKVASAQRAKAFIYRPVILRRGINVMNMLL